MSKPSNFQIHISSKAEFDRAWAILSEQYKITPNFFEQTYKARGVIKHRPGLGYIWSSSMVEHDDITSYGSFDEFVARTNFVVVKPATMNDAIQLVTLDQEIGILQADESHLRQRLDNVQLQIAEKTAVMKALQKKLNIVD